MLVHRRRRLRNINTTLLMSTAVAYAYPENTKHLYNIYTMPAQRLRRWSNIV